MDPSPLRSLPELFSSAFHSQVASHRVIRTGAHGRLAAPVPPSPGTYDNVAGPNRTNPQTTSRFTPGSSIPRVLRRFQCTRPSRGMVRVAKSPATLGIASTVAIFACPSHLPGTVTFDRYLETNQCSCNENVDDNWDLRHQRYAADDQRRELLNSQIGAILAHFGWLSPPSSVLKNLPPRRTASTAGNSS